MDEFKQPVKTTYQNIFEGGWKEGREEGREEGKMEDKEIVALNAFEQDIIVPVIAKIVEMPESFVIDVLKKYGRI